MKQYVDFDEIKKDLIEHKDELLKLTKGIHKIVAITRGGLCVAGLVSQIVGIKNIDTLCLESYNGQERKEVGVVKAQHYNERVLLIDDVIDSGETIEMAKKFCPFAKVLVLHIKEIPERLMPDFYLFKTDLWIVYPWELDE
jgi:xanthine phosphoribosyltransferase